MRIRLTRLTGDRHALEIVRDGVVRERVELETRSFLLHDLIHYAVETTAGVATGVWGTLAAGSTLAALNDRSGLGMNSDMRANPYEQGFDSKTADLLTIELVTGPLQGVVQGRVSAEAALAGITQRLDADGASPPPWLTLEFIERVIERMRQLTGRFRATPFGQPMELSWP